MDRSRDQLSNVAAIWIFACNDEESILTYKGIVDRLEIQESEVHGLLHKHRELFRLGAQLAHIEELRSKYRNAAEDKLPRWLRVMSQTDRSKALDSLNETNVFRSQFRTVARAERSPLNITEWGLNHIENLRKVRSEGKEWWLKIVQVGLTFFSLIVALLTVYISYKNSMENLENQREIKYFETTLMPKQENYAQFMSGMYDAYEAAIAHDGETMITKVKQMNSAYLVLEAYLNSQGFAGDAKTMSKFSFFCDSLYRGYKPSDSTAARKFNSYRLYYRNRFYNDLFTLTNGQHLNATGIHN